MKYKNWVWDLDGTLFDTYPNMTQAFYEALAANGFEASPSSIHQSLKVSLSHAIESFSEQFKLPSDFLALFRTFEKLGQVEPYDWVETCLKGIVHNGGKNFIWTHRDALTFQYLETYQLTQYFTEVVTSDMGFERKPSGQAMRYLIERHKLLAKETLMVGDRELDVLGALDAGVEGILYLPKGEIFSTKAIFTFASFDALKKQML